MGRRRWPTVASNNGPTSILQHAKSLQQDFEAITTFVRDGRLRHSNNCTLPKPLKTKIAAGVADGLKQALGSRLVRKSADQKLLCSTILGHITLEAVSKARDRIPLGQFHGLLDSFSELVAKLYSHASLYNQRQELSPISPTDAELGFEEIDKTGRVVDRYSRRLYHEVPTRTLLDPMGNEIGRNHLLTRDEQISYFIQRAEDLEEEIKDLTEDLFAFRARELGNGSLADQYVAKENYQSSGVSDDSDDPDDSGDSDCSEDPGDSEDYKGHEQYEYADDHGEYAGYRDSHHVELGVQDDHGMEDEGSNQHGVMVPGSSAEQYLHANNKQQDGHNADGKTSCGLSTVERNYQADQQCPEGAVDAEIAGVAELDQDGAPLGSLQRSRGRPRHPVTSLEREQARIESNCKASARYPENKEAENARPTQAQLGNTHVPSITGTDIHTGIVSEQGMRLQEDPNHDPETHGIFSCLTVLHITHQATVNALAATSALALNEKVSVALKRAMPGIQANVWSVKVLESGDVEVIAHIMAQKTLQQLNSSASWAQELEHQTIQPRQVYVIEMSMVPVSSMDLGARRQKAAVIRTLALANMSRLRSLRSMHDIVDISWVKQGIQKERSALIITFGQPEVANEALAQGILWSNHLFWGQPADRAIRIIKCGRCQAFGHDQKNCSAPIHCGRCAEAHSTRTCMSNFLRCASCSGSHCAGDNRCPVKLAERQRPRFLTATGVSPEPSPSHGSGSSLQPVQVPEIISDAASGILLKEDVEESLPVALHGEPEAQSEAHMPGENMDARQGQPPSHKNVYAEIEKLKAVVSQMKAEFQANSTQIRKRTINEVSTNEPHVDVEGAVKRLKLEESGVPFLAKHRSLSQQPSLQLAGRPRGKSV